MKDRSVCIIIIIAYAELAPSACGPIHVGLNRRNQDVMDKLE
jgi:hypothetical protein